jgi:hypothetical protein
VADQTFDPRFDPAFQRGYEPPAKPRAVPSAPLPAGSIGEPPVGPDPQQEKVAPAVVGRRRVNPYVVILWVIGVAFEVGGTALLFGSYFLLFSGSFGGLPQGATAQALYVFGSVFGVPLITVGLATVAGLIFFSAWHSWRRQNGSVS